MRRAIVTGGASGIGAAIVRRLLSKQVRVGLFDVDAAAAEAVASIAPSLVSIHRVDVTQEAEVIAAVDEFRHAAGGIDWLVNCAGGGGRGGELADMTLQAWNARLALNLTSVFLMTREVSRPMKAAGGGAIVNIASLAARRVSPVGGGAYAAAKAGVLALTRQAARELAPHGIRVNAVCPGPTRTALTAHSTRRDGDFPLGRWVEASDVAEPVCFLLSKGASMITGTSVDVDGGAGLSA